MEIFTTDFLWSLMAIVLIDLVLAGDNAIVIGMAARNLPQDIQKKAILLGTIGALAMRAIATVMVVWLLKIPALMMLGGILLTHIAYKLIVAKKQPPHTIASTNLISAVRTIIIADSVMGLDNVMGVAGIANGNMVLAITGLFVTVPIIIWGSTLFIRVIERYPVIIYVGGTILAWTAGHMITGDPLLQNFFQNNLELKWIINFGIIAIIMYSAWDKKRKEMSNPIEDAAQQH